MIVIPAIDLMNKQVVRLSRGDPSTAKVYDQWGPPVQVAKLWKAQGAERLHIIDLDAAFGRGNNMATIAEIARTTGLPIQVGGGIRTIGMIENLLKLGVSHIILGSLVIANPDLIPKLQRRFGHDAFIVALDNKDGKVMMEGWKTLTPFSVSTALEKFITAGIRRFLITSIAKDGMLSGPDIGTLREACDLPGIDVIAAGGISGLTDLAALRQIGVKGVVIGKALYEGRFTLKDALKTVEAT